jgi:hypothetical protein
MRSVRQGGGCIVSCLGLYADVSYMDSLVEDQAQAKDNAKLLALQDEYNNYKNQFAENLFFHPASANFSKGPFIYFKIICWIFQPS